MARTSGRRRSPALAACLLAALAVAGCGRDPSEEQAPRGPATDLATLEVGARATPSELRVDGVVESVEHATLAAQTTGRVAEAPVDVDDAVREGQLILRLSAIEQAAGLGQATAALAAATARDAQARAQFDRIADMYQRKVVARATYDDALAARDAAAAGLVSARAAVDSARAGVAYTEVRAPYDGVVTARHVQPGEAVAPGMPLVDVAGSGPLRVVATVPQSAAAQVRALGKAYVYLGDRRLESTGLTVYPTADPQSGTFRARVELPGPVPGLAPGVHARVGFVTGETPRITLPLGAIVERSELRAVYVVLPAGEVVLRQVRLGRVVGEEVEVIAGLAPGERVATSPAQAGMRIHAGTATQSDE